MAKIKHPDWVTTHKKPGTELKVINNRYYLYGVKSQYDKVLKRSKKISLGILGSITQEHGFVVSEKKELKEKSNKSLSVKEAFCLEYGLAKWLLDTLNEDKILDKLKKHFPQLWQFIVCMVYCRVGYQSPLKNIPFHVEQSELSHLLDYDEKLYDQKTSNFLFDLGSKQASIHAFMQTDSHQKRTVPQKLV